MTAPKSAGDRVPNGPLREALLASDMTTSEVCYRLGWTRVISRTGRTTADSSRLRRSLGLLQQSSKHPRTGKLYHSVNDSVNIYWAIDLCRVLGVEFDVLYPSLPDQLPCGGECRQCGEQLAEDRGTPFCGWCLELRSSTQVAA